MAENNSLLEKLDGLQARFEEVCTLITDPSVIADQPRYVRLTKEYKDFEIDWKSLTIKSKWLPTRVTHIAIYIDTTYINQIASEEGKFDITRMEDAGKGRDLYAGVDYGKKRGLF